MTETDGFTHLTFLYNYEKCEKSIWKCLRKNSMMTDEWKWDFLYGQHSRDEKWNGLGSTK